MDSQSHRASLTRAAAVQACCRALWGSSLLDLNQRALVSSALLGLSIGEHQHHQARTKENDHWPLEQQPSSTTTITTLAPLAPIILVTLAESSGNCALQIHFDPANLKAGSEGG